MSENPIALMMCPLCWNTTTHIREAWCCGNQWGMEKPMNGDHDAEQMTRVEFYGARGEMPTQFVALSAAEIKRMLAWAYTHASEHGITDPEDVALIERLGGRVTSGGSAVELRTQEGSDGR